MPETSQPAEPKGRSSAVDQVTGSAEIATLTQSATTLLEPGMRAIRYADEGTVVAALRDMDDWRLEAAYVEGLNERKRGGPSDGDTARSERLLSLIAAEMDRRVATGEPWRGPTEPPA